MISELYNRHQGCRVAVVGSGPTAGLFRGDCDISIAVNGAALLPHRFAYFMCGDPNSHLNDWFKADCADTRVIADLVATQDRQLYPDNMYYGLLRMAVPQHEHSKLGILPPPQSPHLIYTYRAFNGDRLAKTNTYLMYGGTISCCALQLAWVMGAAIVDIYGCPFTHGSGSYFYHSSYVGAVSGSQLRVMQEVIDRLRESININIIGRSKLV